MTQANTEAAANNGLLWKGRTHFKVLFKPAFIQLVLIAIHILLFIVLPTDTEWAEWNSWGPLILHGIILLVEIWYVIIPVLQWLNAGFEVSENSVISKWGVIYKQSREIPLDSIVSLSMERGILDRIFGCGTLIFFDAAAGFQPQTSGAWNKNRGQGSNQGGVRFRDIPHIVKVQKIIEDARISIRRR